MSIAPVILPVSGDREARIVANGPTHAQIEIDKKDGSPPYRETKYRPGTATHRNRLKREADLASADVLAIDHAAFQAVTAAADATNAHQAGTPPVESRQNIVTVHSQITGEQFEYPVDDLDGLILILRKPVGESCYVRWDDKRMCVVLDCDFHGETVPDMMTIDRLMRDLQPAPRIMHRTTRGFHAIYGAMGGFTAEELGSLAAATLQTNDTVLFYGGSCEILTRTRHPGSVHKSKIYGPLLDRVPDTNAPILSIFDDRVCSAADRQEVQELLGYQLGRRFAHNACVIEPGRASTGEPVVVTEHGLYCHSCAARLGHGMTSWVRLRQMNGLRTDASGDTRPIRDAICAMVPHVVVSRYLEAIAPQVPLRFHRVLHMAMLKRMHGTDVETMLLINSVFSPWTLVRGSDGHWLDSETLIPVTPRPDRAIFNHCSATQIVDHNADGEPHLKPDMARVSALVLNGTPPKGWTPIIPTAQSPVYHQHNASRIAIGVIACRPRNTQRRTVAYLEPAQRMELSEAVNLIRARWPGIDMNYVALVLVARGCAEEGACQLPMWWAMGPTGAGKSATIEIPLAMYGETSEDLTFGADGLARVKDQFGRAQARTSVVTIQEIGKVTHGHVGQQVVEFALQFLLKLLRNVEYHHRFVDMVTTRLRTAIGITDMRVPEAMRRSEQLGRRVVAVPLHEPVSWSGGFLDWPFANPELQKAAETLHSAVIDRFFPNGCVCDFITMAKELGFATCADYWQQGTEQEGVASLVRAFVRELMMVPCANAKYTRTLGVGIVQIETDSASPLSECARMLCGFFGPQGITAQTLIQALEPFQSRLHHMLPLVGPARIEVKTHHQQIFARIVADAQRRGVKSCTGRDLLRPGIDLKQIGEQDPK